MVLVKVCGMRTVEDLAAAEGADFLGFVVGEPRSRRNLPVPVAGRLRREVRGARSVAVTTRHDPEFLQAMLHLVEPDVLQLHGVRDPAVAAVLRALVDGRAQLGFALPPSRQPLAGAFAEHADLLFLDAEAPLGGTGRTHDWTAAADVVRALGVPTFLGGGLTPENVSEAIRIVGPRGVDVSSGVEGAAGKEPARVREFLRRARE